MASQAQKNQKILDAERAKPFPDSDIIYALESTKDYWNTWDNEKASAGFRKIAKLINLKAK